MKLHTIQMGRWRAAEAAGIELFDITVKSGNKCFAPTWDLLNAYRNSSKGKGDEEIYRVGFKKLMNISVRQSLPEWEALCRRDMVAIACYCPEGNFCHRNELVPFLRIFCEYMNIPFEYLGEIS